MLVFIFLSSSLLGISANSPWTWKYRPTIVESISGRVTKSLHDLVLTPLFKYYRLNMCSQCQHKLPPPMCGTPHCSVCECSSKELPCDTSGKCFLAPENDFSIDKDESWVCDESNMKEFEIDRSLDGKAPYGQWEMKGSSHPWSDDDVETMTFVDLSLNQEGWTGYTKDQNSDLIWKAIYEQNCPENTCEEKDFVRRIISGLHTSITTHICSSYCLERKPLSACEKWGMNRKAFLDRVLKHPKYVKNLRFLVALMMTAASKAKDALRAFVPMPKFKDNAKLLNSILKEIDTTVSSGGWKPYKSIVLPPREITRNTFYNISSIMDCVGCEKCKLWGKLQVEGVGTALRILYHDQDGSKPLKLRRTEVVAFINALCKLSFSLELVRTEMPFIHDLEHKEPAWKWITNIWNMSWLEEVKWSSLLKCTG